MPASLAAEESGSGHWAAAGVTPQRRAGSWGSCLCHSSETASVCVRVRVRHTRARAESGRRRSVGACGPGLRWPARGGVAHVRGGGSGRCGWALRVVESGAADGRDEAPGSPEEVMELASLGASGLWEHEALAPACRPGGRGPDPD